MQSPLPDHPPSLVNKERQLITLSKVTVRFVQKLVMYSCIQLSCSSRQKTFLRSRRRTYQNSCTHEHSSVNNMLNQIEWRRKGRDIIIIVMQHVIIVSQAIIEHTTNYHTKIAQPCMDHNCFYLLSTAKFLISFSTSAVSHLAISFFYTFRLSASYN